MAFTPDNLAVVVQPIGDNLFRGFFYQTADTQASVLGADYFTNAKVSGARVGDLIEVYSEADDEHFSVVVTAVGATGTATVELDQLSIGEVTGILASQPQAEETVEADASNVVLMTPLRTLQQIKENAPYLNASWFGAAGDGTDQTTAVQDALDEASTLAGSGSFNLTSGIELFFPYGEYSTETGWTLTGDGVKLRGQSRRGTILSTNTAGITVLRIGDPTYAGQTYFNGVEQISFLAKSNLYDATDTIALQCHDSIFPTFRDLTVFNFHKGIEGFRLNSYVLDGLLFHQQNRVTNQAAFAIGLKGRSTDGLTSGNGKISNFEVFGGATALTNPWEAGVHIMSADGCYISNGHIYRCNYDVLIAPDGTNVGNTVTDILFNNVYFDAPATNCLRIAGSIADLSGSGGTDGQLQNITVNETCHMTGAGGAADNLIIVNVTSNTSTNEVGDFTFNGRMRQAGTTAILVVGPGSGSAAVHRVKVGGAFEDNNYDDGATQSAISANCVDLQVVGAKFGADKNDARRLITYTGAANSGYGLTFSGCDLTQANCHTHASFDGSYHIITAAAGLKSYVGGNSVGLVGQVDVQTRTVSTSDATPRTIYSIGLATNQQIRLSGTIICSSATGAQDGEWTVAARCVRDGSATAIDRETPSTTAINVSSTQTAAITRSTNTVSITVTGIAATDLVWTFIPDMIFLN